MNGHHAAMDASTGRGRERAIVGTGNLDPVGAHVEGFVHDFNENLAAVMGYISLRSESIASCVKGRAYPGRMESPSAKSRDLRQELMICAVEDEPEKEIINVVALIRDSITAALMGRDAECFYAYADNLFLIHGDENQVRHIMTSIILNAEEAMSETGTITITVSCVGDFPKNPSLLSTNHYVKVSIQDEGAGIFREDLTKIFDPHFTTKEAEGERRAGMGLTLAYSMAKKHNGHIVVESSPSIGTTAVIYLPACISREARRVAAGSPATFEIRLH